MGGYGSGRKGGRYGTARTTVEACCKIDINALNRAGVLQPGKHTMWKWTAQRGHTPTAEGLTVVVGGPNRVVIGDIATDLTTGTTRKRHYPVKLVWVPCSWGGERPYFVCPGLFEPCGRHVFKLFKPPTEERFACRRCYNLTHQSSNASGDVLQVAELRRERAMRKLGVSGRDGLSAAKRPKYMHHKTYDRLWNAAVDALFAEDEAFEIALMRHLKIKES